VVDAFTSPATAQLPRYWTTDVVEGSESADAFSQDWRGGRVWAHPPPGRLLEKVELARALAGAGSRLRPPLAKRGVVLAPPPAQHGARLPPSSLHQIAADAPPRLSDWMVVVFKVPGGRLTS
jgi:hypothetical protein